MAPNQLFKYGKSLSTVAKLTGMSVSAVNRALKGRGTSFVNARRIADALGITLDQLWEMSYADGKSRIPVRMGVDKAA